MNTCIAEYDYTPTTVHSLQNLNKSGHGNDASLSNQSNGGGKGLVETRHRPKPVSGQIVTVHCTGFGKNGDLTKKFWSTKDPGQKPFSFQIGQDSVIKGWDEGVLGMQVREVARLRCTPDYAYGPNGFPAWGIQPDLVFEIQVLSVD